MDIANKDDWGMWFEGVALPFLWDPVNPDKSHIARYPIAQARVSVRFEAGRAWTVAFGGAHRTVP